MSTYSIWGYNFIIVPKFDFMLKLESGSSYFLKDRYMKYIALFCLICGVNVFWKMLFRIKPLVNKLIASISKPKVTEGNFVVILGFGDTNASIKLTRYFSRLGYDILALNNKKILSARREHNLNKAEHLDTLPSQLIEHTYEELFSSNLDFLKDKKIEFVFDCSIFRVFTDVSNTSLHHDDAIFFKDEIQLALNDYFALLDLLKNYFFRVKIFLLDYVDKVDDVNHHCVFDMKYAMLSNYELIYRDKIYNLKKIKLYNILKPNLFKESDIKKIFTYSNLKEVEYQFI
jgi:hypothetical protein